MMEKNGKEHIPCTYCDKDALDGTNPPVCADHIHTKQASAGPSTLKELESKGD